MAEVETLLNKGLTEGYAGKTPREKVRRGPFELEASQFTSPEGGIYRDEWMANRTGGGQEIVQTGDKKATRLYAGGTISLDQLAGLGLTKKDVTSRLKQFIQESEGKTRLGENYTPEPDGDWQYKYEIMRSMEEVPLKVGVETVTYKGALVFAHGFLLTTVG